MRATFMPCSPSGIAQPMIASSIGLRVERRHLRQRAADRGDQQVVGPGVAEVAARATLPIGVRVAATM